MNLLSCCLLIKHASNWVLELLDAAEELEKTTDIKINSENISYSKIILNDLSDVAFVAGITKISCSIANLAQQISLWN